MTHTLLGRGPVAAVYATTASGQPVAVKVFPGKFDRKTLTLIERERLKLVKLAGTLPILPIEAIGQWEGKHALRMELCSESLSGRVQRSGALDVEDVVELGYGMASALAAAHSVGILHGGVSPHNVLYRAFGPPVLSDFGVAIRQSFRRNPLHAIECIPPETLRSGVIDQRTDVYGLGAVLHFALTGQSPHPSRIGEQPGERVLRVLGDPVPAISRPDVPIELSTMVARMLTPEAERRPDTATWAMERLGKMLPRPVPHIALPQARRRSKVPYFVAGGLVAAGLAVAPFLWPSSSQTDPPATVPPPPLVTLDLAEPVDQGDHVLLKWASSQPLDSVVVVTPDGGGQQFVNAERGTSIRVPVKPAGGYCFQVRGTNASQIYLSQSKPVRGAVCQR
ncbi:serine/threonine protein kinase [Kibdelosporangium philippinense]|uniref:non-specific serine/threonine protein kinase n=1 Tax=Kibdelosporangium philippinense TaxID=211113 RepID=A0ABS8ZH29_9PSEU|nr:serine/threonine-protein kinase [Kibdelosporangium philippinense]MCE7006639.1 serine/threonine protein kinase [Kibdelosporangium philippinense]